MSRVMAMNTSKRLKNNNLVIRTILILGLATSSVFAGKPNIEILTSAAFPRINLWSAEEAFHWQSIVQYHQEINPTLALNMVFELGSTNDYSRNPLRLYHLNATLNRGRKSLRMGRLSHWSGLTNLRYDGVELALKTEKFGTFTVLAGVEAVLDFSDTNFIKHPVGLLAWKNGRASTRYGVTIWQQDFGDEPHLFSGFQYNRDLFGFRYNQQFSFDVTAGRIQNHRTYLSRNFGRHTAGFGMRQRRYMVAEVYPWIEDDIIIPTTMFMSLKSRVSNNILIWNQASFRLQSHSNIYATSTIQLRRISATIMLGKLSDRFWTGGQIGYSGQFGRAFSYGVKGEFNLVSFNDGVIEPVQSKGSYGWLGWSPGETIMVRVFYRVASNPYYTIDGRGGITVNVAL